MKASMYIRHLKEDDAPLLRNIAYKCPPLDVHTPYTYWVICRFFAKSSFIVEDNNMPIAYIAALETDDTVFIWQIGIIEKYRRKHISSLLIDNVVKYAEEKHKSVSVSIDKSNTASNAAFQSYCSTHSYTLQCIGSLSLYDLSDPLFSENEEIYTLTLTKKYD